MTDSLYVLADGTKSKIGFTSRPLEKRLKEYNTHNPHWSLESHMESDDVDLRIIENTIKAFYKPYKIKGRGEEWFNVSAIEMTRLVHLLVTQAQLAHSSHNRSSHKIPISEIAAIALGALEDSLSIEREGKSVDDLKTLQKRIDDNRGIVRKEFASAFCLGFSSHELQTRSFVVAAKNICPPDLSKTPDQRSPELTEAIFRGEGRIEPPYKDHEERFYVTFPLPTGGVVAFCSALVLMPYRFDGFDGFDDEKWLEKVKEIKQYADIVGWCCTEHSEWSWHAPKSTGLVILQPKTPMYEILSMFEKSFRKFIIENEKIYELEMKPRLSEVVNLIANDACFPLDVESFDDLYNGYIRKYCRMRYDFEDQDDKELIQAYKFLFSEWKKDVSAMSRAA